MKKLFAILFTVILSTSVFAQNTSMFSYATHDTIADESTYLFNLTDWNKLQFDNLFLHVGTIYRAEFNMTAVFNVGNSTIMAGYTGNLWDDSNFNRPIIFWGKNKLALYASYEQDNQGNFNFDGTNYLGKAYVPSAGFGYNFDDKNAISLNVNYISIVGDETTSDLTQIRPTATYRKYIENSKNKTSYLKFIYNGMFTTVKDNATDVSNSYSTNTLTSYYYMETKLAEKLKWGFEVDLPLSYRNLPSFKGFVIPSLGIDNGLSYALSEMFDLNFGYSFYAPTIYIPSEGDVTTGSMYNTYSIGFTFKPAENVKIDAYSTFYPTWGVAVNNFTDSSSYRFSFSVSAKF